MEEIVSDIEDGDGDGGYADDFHNESDDAQPTPSDSSAPATRSDSKQTASVSASASASASAAVSNPSTAANTHGGGGDSGDSYGDDFDEPPAPPLAASQPVPAVPSQLKPPVIAPPPAAVPASPQTVAQVIANKLRALQQPKPTRASATSTAAAAAAAKRSALSEIAIPNQLSQRLNRPNSSQSLTPAPAVPRGVQPIVVYAVPDTPPLSLSASTLHERQPAKSLADMPVSAAVMTRAHVQSFAATDSQMDAAGASQRQRYWKELLYDRPFPVLHQPNEYKHSHPLAAEPYFALRESHTANRLQNAVSNDLLSKQIHSGKRIQTHEQIHSTEHRAAPTGTSAAPAPASASASVVVARTVASAAAGISLEDRHHYDLFAVLSSAARARTTQLNLYNS